MQSMTGYGRGIYQKDERQYQVEIKTVNYKYVDCNIRMPRELSSLEDGIRKNITKNLTRGKAEVNITYVNNSSLGKDLHFNKELAKEYVEKVDELAKEAGLTNNFSIRDLIKMPDVFNIMLSEEDEEILKEELNKAVEIALLNLASMRQKEGEKIKEDFTKRLAELKSIVEKMKEESTGLVEQYIVKLEKRVNEILKDSTVSEDRIAQEAVIYADKTSIEEELTRLSSHISQFYDIMDKNEACGKKLDFLVQEMNREINTIGSKSASLSITNLVVDAKTKLEDIREQIQNIE